MRKFFAIFIALFLLLSIFPVPTFAAEPQKIVVLARGKTVDSDYFGAGNEVRISGTVNGDAYVAGGTVVVDGTINGDLLVAGGNITVTGTVRNNIRSAGGNISISGATVGGNITALGGQINIDSANRLQGSIVAGGGNIQIFATVPRGVTLGGGNVVLGSVVGKDVFAGVGNLTITQNAQINGNLTYLSDQNANIAEGASISGHVKHEIPQRNQVRASQIGRTTAHAAAGFLGILKIFDLVIIIIWGLFFITFFPVYTTNVSNYIRTNFWTSLITGLAVLVLTPIIGILLFVSILGIPFALLLFVLYMILIWISKIFVINTFGQFILARTNNKTGAITTFIVGVVAYLILTLIPIISFLTHLIITLVGVGAVAAQKQKYYSDLRAKKLI
ncbi:MAG TPA: hypothetical protein VG965_06245 [Patescibacteria group bacterium]|nr:hypothetical protein [Patescibacteria group bacterium]